MHYCKNTNGFALLIGTLCLCFFTLVWAANSNLHIKTAELLTVEDAYLLNADFEISFSSEVEAALNKGVPLHFLIEFQMVTTRKYWFDDEIASARSKVTLSYHALSRQYLINRGGHQQSFPTLEEAKEELQQLRNWRVLEKLPLKRDENYQTLLRMRLDQSKLPKPMQVDALSSDDWNMISQRYRWTPVLGI